MTDLTGQYLGRYYLTERLGEGGMAVVYKAYDTRLERDVAVKIIRSGVFPPDDLEQVLKRFEREAKALAKLSHPNIVKVYDYGEHDGSPYLVIEYLPGGTLKKMLDKPVPWQDAVRLILPVARGVAYAHQRGILHRDIKPANVLITDGGEPMLSDFGIAKLFEGNQATALTGSGMAIGTPEYMAPEQWTGITSPQSDQYSLGIVLYEMVAGRKPYVADTPGAILIKQVTEPLPGPRKFVSDLPEDLEYVLIKSLAREPDDRYKDVNAFISALEDLHVSTMFAPPPEPEIVEPTSKVQVQEPAVSIPPQLSSRDDGETIRIEEPGEAQKVEEETFSPPSVVRHPPSVKFSRKAMGLLFGGAILVVALWLGSPSIGKWFSPVSVSTEQATSTLDLIFPSQTLEALLPSETPTLEVIPAEVSSPTPAPLPMEITDEKGASMVLVPAGEFTMGSDSGSSGEKPAHQVYLDAFYIDKYEVTNALYKACAGAGVCGQPADTTRYNNSQYAQHPVVDVDWNIAKTYCEWRSARLPTEAEWEKTARGTDGRTYPWGEGIDCSHANYYDGDKFCVGSTAPVGSYESGKSPFGAYDMTGNVYEWVSDWYDENYYASSPKSNPTGPINGSSRVLRGGSWSIWLNLNLRSFIRSWGPAEFSGHYIGFRCALPATSGVQPAPVETVTTLPIEEITGTWSYNQFNCNGPGRSSGYFVF